MSKGKKKTLSDNVDAGSFFRLKRVGLLLLCIMLSNPGLPAGSCWDSGAEFFCRKMAPDSERSTPSVVVILEMLLQEVAMFLNCRHASLHPVEQLKQWQRWTGRNGGGEITAGVGPSIPGPILFFASLPAHFHSLNLHQSQSWYRSVEAIFGVKSLQRLTNDSLSLSPPPPTASLSAPILDTVCLLWIG